MYPPVNQPEQGLRPRHFLAEEERGSSVQKAWLPVEILLLVKLAPVYLKDKNQVRAVMSNPGYSLNPTQFS